MQIKTIVVELKHHAPFTVLGAVTGIIVMFFFQKLPKKTAFDIFYTLHPLHVFLSALVTAAVFKLHSCKVFDGKCVTGRCNFLFLIVIGYIGSVGIATLSDSIIPYFGELMLDMPHRHIHIGFIEKWWLVNPLAVIGVLTAFFWPKTKFPHAGHVLLSTWASVFHIIMAVGAPLTLVGYLTVFIFLFFAVWVPCCVSDIVFPLLFIRGKNRK
jgi:hypothetical protein